MFTYEIHYINYKGVKKATIRTSKLVTSKKGLNTLKQYICKLDGHIFIKIIDYELK